MREALISIGYAAETANSLANRVYTSWDSTDAIQTPAKRYKSSYTRKTVPVAKSVKKYVKRCMDRVVEPKYTNRSTHFSTSATTAAVETLGLELIQQGNASTNREGNILHVTRVDIRGRFYTPVTTGTSAIVRLIMVKDKMCQGATIQSGQVLNDNTNYLSQFNQDFCPPSGNRFQILKEWNLSLFAENPTSVGARRTFKATVKFPNGLPVRYDGNTGTVADLTGNNIGFVYIAESATAFCQFTTQTYFRDN